jgi:hypothetical protein
MPRGRLVCSESLVAAATKCGSVDTYTEREVGALLTSPVPGSPPAWWTSST